jgi:long-chain acyl-CoA synthetase
MELKYKYNNFYEIINANANNSPKKTVIFTHDSKINNKELLSRVDTFARFLELSGVRYKDKVAIVLSNSEYFIIALFAITKIGAIAVPINNFLKKDELEFIINNCDAKVLVSTNTFANELTGVFDNTHIQKIIWTDNYKNLDERNYCFDEILKTSNVNEKIEHIPTLDDTAIIIYTSGTTGNPKGAMLSYKNILSNSISGTMRMGLVPKDRFIVYLPMFHSFTLSIMVILPFFNNSSIVIVKSIFPFANVLKQILLKRVTIFLGAPQIYTALNKAKIPWYFMWFHKIRGFVSGSAPMSEQVMTEFKNKFKGALFLEGYGLSECSPAVCINPIEKQKILSVGIPLPSYETKVVDEEMIEVKTNEVGELIVKGDCVMQEYYNDEEATKETIVNGWLKTGDFAKIDDEGYIYIVDRKKDLIISKGINIYPREIEELIYQLEDVESTAVIGLQDATKDEKILAFIQIKDDVETKLTSKKVKDYLKENLANFKIPKEVHFIDNMPKNALNKVLKRKLKEDLSQYI